MIPIWPDELPAPLKSVSARPVSPIVRSKMVSGRTFVRRNFTAVPVVYRMTWLFDSEQAVIFENFFRDDLEDGTRWFEMKLRVARIFTKAATWWASRAARFGSTPLHWRCS